MTHLLFNLEKEKQLINIAIKYPYDILKNTNTSKSTSKPNFTD